MLVEEKNYQNAMINTRVSTTIDRFCNNRNNVISEIVKKSMCMWRSVAELTIQKYVDLTPNIKHDVGESKQDKYHWKDIECKFECIFGVNSIDRVETCICRHLCPVV